MASGTRKPRPVFLASDAAGYSLDHSLSSLMPAAALSANTLPLALAT
jgi:hypothetical protein